MSEVTKKNYSTFSHRLSDICNLDSFSLSSCSETGTLTSLPEGQSVNSRWHRHRKPFPKDSQPERLQVPVSLNRSTLLVFQTKMDIVNLSVGVASLYPRLLTFRPSGDSKWPDFSKAEPSTILCPLSVRSL